MVNEGISPEAAALLGLGPEFVTPQEGPRGIRGWAGRGGPRGPRGNQGDKGNSGKEGKTGSQGPKGDKGDSGDRGETGKTGNNGSQGIRGRNGPRGDKGERGLLGPIGRNGTKGEKGDKGDRGEKGDRGPKGDNGEHGPKGDKGDRGPEGLRGVPGRPGIGGGGGGGSGGGGVTDHDDLSNVTANQHHARDHAASHYENQIDELLVELLGTSELDSTKRLAPDGLGGLQWAGGGVGLHDLLSASHPDTDPHAVKPGDVIVGNDTPLWSAVALSVPAAGFLNVFAVANGETMPSWKAAVDNTNPADVTTGAASPGTAVVFARRDHVHHSAVTQYTDEMAQDAVGGILTDSTTVAFTYNDLANTISASVIAGGIDHGGLGGLADDDHLQYALDTHAFVVVGAVPARLTAGRQISAGTGISFTDNGAGGTLVINSTITQYTNEDAQDAVGGILTDTTSIDFTYDDAGNTISAVVLPAGVDHGGLGGLGDDDHTQYALLAGRAGGQTLIGGTAASNELVLHSTSNATKGPVRIEQISGVIIDDGWLVAAATGAAPANNVDGDASFKRLNIGDPSVSIGLSGAIAQIIGSTTNSGWLRVGSNSAPTNVTAGDITGVRLSIGNAGAFGNPLGTFVDVSGTLTPTSNPGRFSLFTATIAPASNSTSEFRTFNFSALIAPPTGVTLSVITGGFFENRNRSDAAVNVLYAAQTWGLVIDSSSPATVGTIGAVIANRAVSYNRPSGTSTVTIGEMIGLEINPVISAGLTVSNSFIGLALRSPSLATLPTDWYGAHFGDSRVTIGGDQPNYSTSTGAATSTDGADAQTAITRTMPGFELAADEMNTVNKYTAALKFMSTDSIFTTENPKLLAYIVGVSTETYSVSDTRGGMILEFGVSANTPGATNVPVAVMQMLAAGNVVLGYERVGSLTAPSNVTAGDLTAIRFRVGTSDAAFTAGVTAAEFIGRNRFGGTDTWQDIANVATIANITAPAAGDTRIYTRLNADLAGATNFKTLWAKDENGFESAMSLRVRSMWPIPITATTTENDAALPANNTTANVAQCKVEFPIKVNKILYTVPSAGGNAANVIRIAIYSENGTQKYIDVTDAVGTATGVRTIDITDTTFAAGVYIVLICHSTFSTTANHIQFYTYSTTNAAHIAGEPDYSGTLTITAGAAPATIDPTALTTVTNNKLPVLRLLGTALGS